MVERKGRSEFYSALNLPKRTIYWIKERADEKKQTFHEYVTELAGVPSDYRTDLIPESRYAEDLGKLSQQREQIRQIIVQLTQEAGGCIKYSVLLEKFPAHFDVPEDWLTPLQKKPKNHVNKFTMFLNTEHRRLITQEVMERSPRSGYWQMRGHEAQRRMMADAIKKPRIKAEPNVSMQTSD